MHRANGLAAGSGAVVKAGLAATLIAVAAILPGTVAVSAKPPEAAPGGSAGVRFETEHVDTPAPARRAFSYVERIWSSVISSDVPVRIRVTFRPLKAKAATVPRPIRGFPGAVDGYTWYPAALADRLAGRDVDPGSFDMEIFFSDEVDWYYGTDGIVPGHLVDFVSVALHEVAHGLGFASSLGWAGGGAFEGSDGERRPPDLSFQVPDLDELPTVFDRFLEDRSGNRLMEIKSRVTRSTCLGTAVLDGALYFGGERAVRRAGGKRPRLGGVDPSHVDQKLYEWSRDGLMTPKILEGRALHEPGPVVLGVLEDLGWKTLVAPAEPVAAEAEEPEGDGEMASFCSLNH